MQFLAHFTGEKAMPPGGLLEEHPTLAGWQGRGPLAGVGAAKYVPALLWIARSRLSLQLEPCAEAARA